MTAAEYLENHGIKFELTKHHKAYTAVDLAVEEHVLSFQVAKPVVVKADGIFYLCVLPACFKIDFDRLAQHLSAKNLRLATEEELVGLFPGCELGAEPPIGIMYGLPTLMDKSLERDNRIVFQAGTHDQAIRMKMKEFKKLVSPHIISFIQRDEFDQMQAMIYDPLYYDSFVYNPLYPL